MGEASNKFEEVPLLFVNRALLGADINCCVRCLFFLRGEEEIWGWEGLDMAITTVDHEL